MPKWDYLTKEVQPGEQRVSRTLTEAGEEGWELVSVTPMYQGGTQRVQGDYIDHETRRVLLIFKRPRP